MKHIQILAISLLLSPHLINAQTKLTPENPVAYQYLLKHFGKDAPPLYPIEDKRMFNGNYLIDDNPRLSSVARAPWHHILFDRGYKYNQNNGKVGQLKGDWEYVVKKIDELSLYTINAE